MIAGNARRSSPGLALVEFTMMLPLLLMLSLGSVDLGRGLVSYMELEQAAQEGALYGSFAPGDPAAIDARVRSSAVGIVPFSDTTLVNIRVTCPTAKVAVRLRYTIPLFTPLLGPLLGGSISLETRSVGTNFTDVACTPTS